MQRKNFQGRISGLRKIAFVLFPIFILSPVFLRPCFGAGTEEIQLSVNGQYRGTVELYDKDPVLYLDARKIMSLLGGMAEWYPVSGRLTLVLKGHQAKFEIKSDQAYVGGGVKAEFAKPLLLRGSKIFLTMDFWTSKYFRAMLRMNV